jgi:hypothetical protein
MDKKTKYAICGATIFTIANGLYNIIKQSNAKDENPDYKPVNAQCAVSILWR